MVVLSLTNRGTLLQINLFQRIQTRGAYTEFEVQCTDLVQAIIAFLR